MLARVEEQHRHVGRDARHEMEQHRTFGAEARHDRSVADQPRAEAWHVLLAFFQHGVGQMGRKVAHGKEGQATVIENRLGKGRIVADVGHGTLDHRVPCAVFPCKGGAFHNRVVAVHRVDLETDGGEQVLDRIGHPR